MESIRLWARNGAAVRQAIEVGEMAPIETASEEFTDEFLLLAIESGLVQSWAGACPDPRCEPEIAMAAILPAHRAARCAGLYAMRQAGYVRRAARVWGAVGSSVEGVEPARGLALRGTADDKLFRGAVVRKLLVQMAQQAARSQPAQRPPQEPSVAVKVRERASRRAVKPPVDAAEAEARAHKVAEPLVGGDNQPVGVSRLQDARLGRGRRLPLLDTTDVAVAWETGPSAWRGVVKHEDGTRSRGYQRATVRTLLDSAGRLTQVALSALQGHDMAVCRPWLAEAPVVRAGDLLREERGFIDGATVSALKRQRRVDVIIPLKAHRLATQEAVQLAERADKWHAQPSRADQRMALGRGVEHLWAECAVPLNACVIRFWNTKKKRTDPIVLVTTDLERNAPWIVRHDEERPEIEQAYEQMKSGGWQLQQRSSTRYSEIVFYVLTVVLSYSLYHLFVNTQAGARFADKTRQAIVFDPLRTPRTHLIVYAGGSFEIFETLSFVQMVWPLSPPMQERLRTWLAEHLNQIPKREWPFRNGDKKSDE